MPLIAAESDETKRKLLQDRATTYMERAEEIQRSFKEAYVQQNHVKGDYEQTKTEASCSSNENQVKQAVKPNSNYNQLCRFLNK